MPVASIQVAVDTLRRNPMRTILSTLGIIIGVGALMTILNLSDSLERYTREQIEKTTDLQTLVVSSRTSDFVDGVSIPRVSPAVLTEDVLTLLSSAIGERGRMSLMMNVGEWISVVGDTVRTPAVVTAVLPAIRDVTPIAIVAGSFLSAADTSAVVLSQKCAAKLAAGKSVESMLGRELVISGVRMRVAGIAGQDESDQASRAYILLASAPARLWIAARRQFPIAIIKARSVEDVQQVRTIVERVLAGRFGAGNDAFTIVSRSERVAQAAQGMMVFKLVMGCITGISLLVGGIGIMNILLASISERTREIGIRKAAGARRWDILTQFLAESVVISGLGGIIGILLGFLMSTIATAVIRSLTQAPMHYAFFVTPVLISFGASFAVGVFFGLYPALHASKLTPTDALRYE